MDFEKVKQAIMLFPDFPQPGVNFKDISPLLENPQYFTFIVDAMTAAVAKMHVNKIVAIDARGFLFGSAIAYKLKKSLVICRKKGKLPGELVTRSYQYEYSTSEISIQRDKLNTNDIVAIVDDVLATGSTAKAAYEIIEQYAYAAGFICLIELDSLKGRNNLLKKTTWPNTNIISFIHYS
ncbi:MAG: adenine phosphoribosyltransferase [Patescibacteria group bacterium]|nr:adenine phosphoribosyltransferase [Patescibacteria group bacterium]MDE2590225.1 adenine phosphoribosyltransferase [Patescibacteria group bacterium]